MAYYEGEISGLGSNYNNGTGWGWEGLIGLVIAASIFNGGFGGGFGGFGGRYGAGGFLDYELGKVATVNDLAAGFNNSSVLSNLNSLKEGQLQMINYNNQGFAGLNSQLITGFNNVNSAICNLGFQNQAGINQISREIGECCCKTNASIADLKYANEKQTSDIINAINVGNQRLVDIYTSDKIDTLNRKLATAEAQLSNNAQTAAIVGALSPKQPIPSYYVPNPNCCYTPCGTGCGGANII